MSDFTVFARQLFTPKEHHGAAMEVRDGRVAVVRQATTGEPIRPPMLVVPGFVDTHVHGGFGLDLMDGSPDTVKALASKLPSVGVAAFIATQLTAPWPAIRKAVEAARSARKSGGIGARMLGCHLEGPFLNPKYKGAQRGDEMAEPSFAVLEKELGDLLNEVLIVTLAPEVAGALETIRELVNAGIAVSVGHTNATYDEVSAAIDAGASRATHCFNAMRAMHHREPGTVGAVLSRPELTAEVIWDNIHVHPSVCKVLVAAKPGKVVAVSDGTTGVGMPEGYRFDLWGLPARVADGAARLDDGTLAGSTIGMADAFRNAVKDVPIEAAVFLCSTGPAISLVPTAEAGCLTPDAPADFVLLDPDSLAIHSTYIGGVEVYRSGQ